MFHISLNVAILALFYTLLGGFSSYFMHCFFDDFDASWKSKSLSYRILDVCIELILIALVGFWPMFYIREAPPIFPVSKVIDELVDSYNSGIFYSFALFLFFDDLTSKIKYLYAECVDPVVKKKYLSKARF
jgi:hypothetical protein